MRKFIYKQIVNHILRNYSFSDSLFKERRLVFFAEKRDDDGTEKEGEGIEIGTEEEKKPEEAEEITEAVGGIMSETWERSHSILDELEYDLPPDIDPDRIKESRKVMDVHYPELKKLEGQVDGKVSDFMKEMGASGNEGVQDKIWKLVYSVIPEYTHAKQKENKQFSPNLVPANLGKPLRDGLKKLWQQNTDKKLSARMLNKYVSDFLKMADEISKHEFEMLKTINEVKEVMWDMYNRLQKDQIEKRMLEGAERYVGLPIYKDMEYVGSKKIMTAVSDDEVPQPTVKGLLNVWKVKDVYIDKRRAPDPEVGEKQKSMMMKNVWVAIEDKAGRTYRMTMNRFKDFANLYNLRPLVNNLEDLKERVPYLTKMGIELKEGMEIEYDEWDRDETTGRPVKKPQKVKITTLNDQVVEFDKEVLYRAKYDSPALEDHEFRTKMDLDEFAKWLHHRHAIPTMDFPSFEEKLDEHFDYMNNKYKKRLKDCHRPIIVKPGEVLFADAPGNPLFEIKNVDPQKGTITLSNGRVFTFQQFIRWVYQYDMEPYDPELEGQKAGRYMNMGKGRQQKAQEQAEQTIDHFRKTGIWRKTLDDLKSKGLKGIFEPEVPMKEFEQTTANKQSYSFMRDFYRKTHFLRIDDLFQLFKSGWEYYERNWKRRQKTRYSAIGKGIPWFGTEFERVNQSAENEEVQQFKDAMDQWGISQIEKTLYETGNKDQAKACINVLAEKGMLRWDDPRLWITLNKFTDINIKIPIPAAGMDPYLPFKEGTGLKFLGQDVAGKNGMDFLPEVLDSLWGESSFISWKRQNDGSIEDSIQKSYNKAEELENDPKNIGGIAQELTLLLDKHMNNEWVDPTEYEGLLRFIIEAGKAGGQHKMYFLLMGVNAENSQGRTIMGWERIGRFVSKYSNQFPALDYFSSSNKAPKRDAKTGEIFTRQFIRSDFKHLTDKWIDRGKQKKTFLPEDDAMQFLWKEVLTSDAFQIRLEKGIRNAQNIDHDDSPFFIPALKEAEIETACASTGGETKKFTIQGYKNAYIGFGFRMQALVDKYDDEKGFEDKGQVGFKSQYLQQLVTSFKSFVRYDGILSNRYRRKEGSRLQRLSSADMRSGCVWDGNNALIKYQNEVKDMILAINKAYKRGNDPDLNDLPFRKLPSIRGNRELEKQQDEIEASIENFGQNFEAMVMSDGGRKMMEIVRGHEFFAEKNANFDEATQLRNKMQMEVFESEMSPELQESQGVAV